MIISAIYARSENHVIGKDNQLPWHLKNDMKFFRRTTLNHHVLLGRKSFESIGRPLPKRTNIILTRQPFYAVSGCCIVHSIKEGLELAEEHGEKEIFILGGGEIYKQSEPLWDKLYMTVVHAELEGDAYAPELDMTAWALESEEKYEADSDNDHDHTISIFNRK